jgi:hypothetical protein
MYNYPATPTGQALTCNVQGRKAVPQIYDVVDSFTEPPDPTSDGALFQPVLCDADVQSRVNRAVLRDCICAIVGPETSSLQGALRVWRRMGTLLVLHVSTIIVCFSFYMYIL